MPFGMWALEGPSNHVLYGGPNTPRERTVLAVGIHGHARGHARGQYIQQDGAAFYRITSISCYVCRRWQGFNVHALHFAQTPNKSEL